MPKTYPEKFRQEVVLYARKIKNNSEAARQYNVSMLAVRSWVLGINQKGIKKIAVCKKSICPITGWEI